MPRTGFRGNRRLSVDSRLQADALIELGLVLINGMSSTYGKDSCWIVTLAS
jgi:hypothetical protein